MAKRAVKNPAAVLEETTSDLLTGMLGVLSEREGIETFNVGSFHTSDVGIALPALSARFAFQSTVMLLSRYIQLIGEEGSAKSAFLAEMGRWILNHNGLFFFAENENKDTRTLRHSLMHWDKKLLPRIVDKPTKSMEQWQNFITTSTMGAQHLMTKKGSPGRTLPMLFGVDSLMSTPTQETIDAVLKAGYASRSFPGEALVLAKYFRVLPTLIGDFPFIFVSTNHAKPAKTPQGIVTYEVPGGKASRFAETQEFFLKREKDLTLKDSQGIRIRIKNMKNGQGPARKSMSVNMIWRNIKDADGITRQYTTWDWHSASIDLLFSFPETAYIRDPLMDSSGVRIVNQTKKQCYSERLGAGDKSNPITFYEMSQALEARPDVLRELYSILHITPGAPFVPGTCYLAQRHEALKKAAELGETRYAKTPLLPLLTGDELLPDVTDVPNSPHLEEDIEYTDSLSIDGSTVVVPNA